MIKEILNGWDITNGGISKVIPELTGKKYSLQAVWSGLTGTLDGTIKVLQSNDGINYDQLMTLDADGAEVDFDIDLDSAAGSETIEDKDGFMGKNMMITLGIGSLTAGLVSLYLNIVD